MVVPIRDNTGGPLGGPGAQALLGGGEGPLPAEILARFRTIKVCLALLIGAILVRLISGVILDPRLGANALINCMLPIMNSVSGIFLLKDDVLFGRVYKCLLWVFCRANGETVCPGGTRCLCQWFFFCSISAFFGLLPVSKSSDILTTISGFMLIFDTKQELKQDDWAVPIRSPIWVTMLALYSTATAVGLLAQLVGGYVGYKGFQHLGRIQYEENVRPHELAGMPGFPAAPGGDMEAFPGVPQPLGESTTVGRDAAAAAMLAQQGGRLAPQGPGFQPFAGEGHKLTD